MPGKKAKAYAVPASAFEEAIPAAAESPAERAARKAAKAARKEAKASAKAGGAPAAAPEAAAEEKPKKRKRDAAAAAPPSPSADAPAAKAAKAGPRLSNAEYRTAHEIKARGRRAARAGALRANRTTATQPPQTSRAAFAAAWPRRSLARPPAGGHRLP
jgi:hypothetical protein